MSRCRSCRAEIVWRRTENGKGLPLDAEPNPAGNVIVVGQTAVVLGKGDPRLTDESIERWIPHFATCPSAASHRR